MPDGPLAGASAWALLLSAPPPEGALLRADGVGAFGALLPLPGLVLALVPELVLLELAARAAVSPLTIARRVSASRVASAFFRYTTQILPPRCVG